MDRRNQYAAQPMPETAPAAAGKECKFSPKPRKNDLVTLTLLRHPHNFNMRAN
jgi:hypothetical protein